MNSVSIDYTSPQRGMTPRQQTGAFNNAMAQAYAAGDPRYQMKRLDRAGMSRGGAQANEAGITAAKEVSDGIAKAYQQSIDDSHYNAMTDLNSQVSREQFAQALGGLQQQRAYADQMALLQRQQQMVGLLKGLLD